MSDLDTKRIVEAILFAADSPVSLDRLVEIVGDGTRSDVRSAIDELNDEYDREGHSFNATEIANGWQLYVKPEYATWAKELHRGRMPTRLSQAALETLAIVAYKQPIVRAEIEVVRGVDSSGVLATLLRRGLVTIAGRAPGMGRALMYRTTKEFLRYFGLTTITDMPRLEEFAEVLGLKPDELELAVEGAESMASVVTMEDIPTDVPDVDRADAPDEPGDAERRDDEETLSVDPDELSAAERDDGEPSPDEDDRALVGSVSVPETGPGEDRHRIRDQDILDSPDEA